VARRRALPAAVGAALAAVALTLVLAAPSRAEEVFTSQAAAAHATDSTWIPAPPTKAAVCIIDTGNDPNPDTTNVIARLSVDNGDGLDRNPGHHGTLMSMIASAPYNGFGMVGAAPSINVVSVRASRDGTTFAGSDLGYAIQKCVNKRTAFNIKVISLSLGAEMLSNLDTSAMALVENNVESARQAGLNVVAAAGNHVGAVDWPAAYRPVLAVGALAQGGALCSFAAYGPEVDLWASGCPVDAATPDGTAVWANGSSEAAAFVGGALTQVRGLRSDLTVDDSEQALITYARGSEAGPALDLEAAFRALGLAGHLAVGHSHIPAGEEGLPSEFPTSLLTPTPSSSVSPGGSDQASPKAPLVDARPAAVTKANLTRLAKPVASARYRRRLLTIRFHNRPRGAEVRIQIYSRSTGRIRRVRSRSLGIATDMLRTRVSGTLSKVSMTYRDPASTMRASAPLVMYPK
jgi:hypothetical protein